MYWILALTATFMIQIGNIYVANIVFFVCVIIRMLTGQERYKFDKTCLHIYVFYIVWILFSMLIFALQYGYFSTRNIIQFLYNFQYLILIVDSKLDKNKLRYTMKMCSIALAVTIIGLWVVKMGMMSIPVMIVNDRMWAENYLGGWPNSIVLPLIFGIYMLMHSIMRERKVIEVVWLGVLLFALLLCGSRTGYIGAALVIVFILFTEREGTKLWWKIIKHTVSIAMIAVAVGSVISIISTNDMGGRMFMIRDRLEIYKDALVYASSRPLSGYGGNTIDVIYEVVGKTSTGMNWGHTHNTVFELLIRHGFIGLVAFLLMVYRVSKLIIQKEDKAMYWILWILSLFQIYYKDFVFLMLVYMLIPSKNNQVNDSLDVLRITNAGKT